MLTRPTEGQVVRHHIGRKKVFLVILSHIGLMGHVTHEDATRLLVSQVEETCTGVAQVRLKVEQEVDLVG